MKRSSNQTHFWAEKESPETRGFPDSTACSGHRTLVRPHPKKGRGLVAMETPRMSGRWDVEGLHHLEDFRGVTAEGVPAWQLLTSLYP